MTEQTLVRAFPQAQCKMSSKDSVIRVKMSLATICFVQTVCAEIIASISLWLGTTCQFVASTQPPLGFPLATFLGTSLHFCPRYHLHPFRCELYRMTARVPASYCAVLIWDHQVTALGSGWSALSGDQKT